MVTDKMAARMGPEDGWPIRAARAGLRELYACSLDHSSIDKTFSSLKTIFRTAADRTVDRVYADRGRVPGGDTPRCRRIVRILRASSTRR